MFVAGGTSATGWGMSIYLTGLLIL